MMVPKALEAIFFIGQILTITPSFTSTKVIFCQKLYYFTVFTFIVLCNCFTIYNREFYKTSVLIKTTICVLLDINLLVFNFYSTMMVIFWKKNQWQKLLGNLKVIVSDLDNRKINRNVTIMVSVLVTEFIILYLVLFMWVDLYGWYYFKQYNIQYFQYYLLFSYNIFLCLILSLMLLKSKKLYGNMQQIYNSKDNSIVIFSLKKIEESLCFLNDTVDIFNDVFGWINVLSILFVTMNTLNIFDFMFTGTIQNPVEQIPRRVMADGILVLISFGTVAAVILMCDLVLAEFENIQALSYKFPKIFNILSPKDEKDLNNFIITISRNFPKFTAARFFKIKRSTILNIMATIITFFIIMVQFQTSPNC